MRPVRCRCSTIFSQKKQGLVEELIFCFLLITRVYYTCACHAKKHHEWVYQTWWVWGASEARTPALLLITVC